jgi:hypothetical protein
MLFFVFSYPRHTYFDNPEMDNEPVGLSSAAETGAGAVAAGADVAAAGFCSSAKMEVTPTVHKIKVANIIKKTFFTTIHLFMTMPPDLVLRYYISRYMPDAKICVNIYNSLNMESICLLLLCTENAIKKHKCSFSME